MNKTAQCSSSVPLSDMNSIFTPIFVIIKMISGKELVFFIKLEPVCINTGLKYNEFVNIAIHASRKSANPVVGPKKVNHVPVLHFKVVLTYAYPFLQSKIVANNKNV